MKTAKQIACGFALAAAGTLGLMFASPAGAADETVIYTNTSGDEEITVTAPRYAPLGHLGGPIQNVSMTREVRFDDLDLRTNHGARVLRSRIAAAARTMCRELEVMHPVKADNSPDCYTTALDDAMAQADDAIAAARGLAYGE